MQGFSFLEINEIPPLSWKWNIELLRLATAAADIVRRCVPAPSSAAARAEVQEGLLVDYWLANVFRVNNKLDGEQHNDI